MEGLGLGLTAGLNEVYKWYYVDCVSVTAVDTVYMMVVLEKRQHRQEQAILRQLWVVCDFLDCANVNQMMKGVIDFLSIYVSTMWRESIFGLSVYMYACLNTEVVR